MTFCDDFIEKAKKELPELCTTKDLMKLGIYRSPQAATHARQTGRSSEYFKLPTGTIVHPKEGVIQLLMNSKHEAKGISENNYTRGPYSQSSSCKNQEGFRL